jgi:hypothetical protein
MGWLAVGGVIVGSTLEAGAVIRWLGPGGDNVGVSTLGDDAGGTSTLGDDAGGAGSVDWALDG